MKNKHGIEIEVGTVVVVPDPEENDIWTHSFQATVTDIIRNNLIVEDQDSDFFEVEADRIEEIV